MLSESPNVNPMKAPICFLPCQDHLGIFVGQDWTGETSLGNGGGRGKLGFVNTWFQKSKL